MVTEKVINKFFAENQMENDIFLFINHSKYRNFYCFKKKAKKKKTKTKLKLKTTTKRTVDE